MATWNYEARTVDGRIVRGTRDAADRSSALDALRAEGLFINRLEARTARAQSAAPLRPRAPINNSAQNGGVATLNSPAESINVERAATPTGPPINSAANPVSGAPLNIHKPLHPAPRFDPVTAAPAPPAHPMTHPNSARPMGQSAAAPLVNQPFLHASAQDLSNFFRQLAALMHAGTGIGGALQTMSENAANNSLRTASVEMSRRALTGGPVSESMEAFPGLFSPLMIGITRAGERGGFLERSFTRLADYAERDYQLQQAIKRETWYPKLIVFCSILIPGVVPWVLVGFQAFLRQVLPPLIVLALLYIAIKVWHYVKPAFTSRINDYKVGGFSPAKTYDEIKLLVPIVGKTARALASAKFCRALGALYSAGVGPSEAVRLGAQACGNRAVAERALATIPQLNAGAPLTQCMKETRVFNPLALQMMRIGEESGDLDTQLDKAADFLETNAETTIKQAVPVLGIIAFLCVALYVGSLAMGVVGDYGRQLDDLMKQ